MQVENHRSLFYRLLANVTGDSRFLNRQIVILSMEVSDSTHLRELNESKVYQEKLIAFHNAADTRDTARIREKAMQVVYEIRDYVSKNDPAYKNYTKDV